MTLANSYVIHVISSSSIQRKMNFITIVSIESI